MKSNSGTTRSRKRATQPVPAAVEVSKEAPFDPTTARIVERLSDELVVLSLPRLHRKPQVLTEVKMRKDGWCRVTCKFLPKGSLAFAPLTRAIAYCYIDSVAVRATKQNGYVGAKG